MARGTEKNIVGGEIDPFVQQSMQQNKQQAESRLLTAMQQRGQAERGAMQEAGATERTQIQAGAQRDVQASRTASEDKRAAEDEIARREDRKFAQNMAEENQEFRARQAELDRDQQNAIIAGDREAKDKIDKRRFALRKFDIKAKMVNKERNVNAILTMSKMGLNHKESQAKAESLLIEEADQFDKDKKIYTTTIENVSKAVENDKRMSLPVEVGVRERMEEKTPSKLDIAKGIAYWGPLASTKAVLELKKYAGRKKEVREAEEKGFANPMGFFQDQIDKYGGKISIENLTSGNISNIEEQIINREVKTEDVNKTLGVTEGMLNAITAKRTAAVKNSEEENFWQDLYMEINQMQDVLRGLADSKKKIEDSDKETVGSVVNYALGTVDDNSLGGLVARQKALSGGNMSVVFDEMTKSIPVSQLWEITDDMDKYEIAEVTWRNNFMISKNPELFGEEADFMGPQLEGAGESASDFNPEGSDYDYNTARAAGGKQDTISGHWSSLDPRTGMVLKGRNHPTWDLMMEEEERLGNKVIKRNGRYYSVKK